MIRMSSLPIASRCAMSVVEPEVGAVGINSDSEAARLGSAVHYYASLYVRGEAADIEKLAAEYDCSLTDLYYHCGQVRTWWKKLLPALPGPLAEVSVSLGDGYSGTADVVATDGTKIIVLDWKTGRIKKNYFPQLKGYLLASMRQFGVDHGQALVVWTNFGEFEAWGFMRDELEEWFSDLDKRLSQPSQKYRPGDHCEFCEWRAYVVNGTPRICPAWLAMTSADISSVIGEKTAVESLVIEKRFGEAYDIAHRAEKAAGAAKTALKEHLKHTQGKTLEENGRLFTMGQVKTSRFDQNAAIEALRADGHSPDEFYVETTSERWTEKKAEVKDGGE